MLRRGGSRSEVVKEGEGNRARSWLQRLDAWSLVGAGGSRWEETKEEVSRREIEVGEVEVVWRLMIQRCESRELRPI